MDRGTVVGILTAMTVVLLASVALASDSTKASTQLDVVGTSSGAWASRILLIGFIGAIGWKALESRVGMGLATIIAVPITFIIIGGLLLGGPALLGPLMASGATLP